MRRRRLVLLSAVVLGPSRDPAARGRVVERGFSDQRRFAGVEAIDLEILRQMYRGGRWVRWGIDPRISLQGIAAKIGVQRGLVAAHVRKWRRDGFLLGSHASPSLSLFGCGLLAMEFPVANSHDAAEMMNRLELVDGIISAKTFCGDIRGERTVNGLWVLFVQDHPRSVERRVRLLRDIFPSERFHDPVQLGVPTAPASLSALDWKILDSFLEQPEIRLGVRAESLGVTEKTLARRLGQLIENDCLDYDLLLDWTKSPTVAIALIHAHESDLRGIHQALSSRFRFFLTAEESSPSRSLRAPEALHPRLLWVVVPVESPSEVHQIADTLRNLPGVVDARPDYWGFERFYPEWYVSRVSEKLTSIGGAAR